jgi:hypothetical protein
MNNDLGFEVIEGPVDEIGVCNSAFQHREPIMRL